MRPVLADYELAEIARGTRTMARMWRRWARLALGVGAAGLLAVVVQPPATAHAFTLINPTIKLYVNPSAGYTTSLVQVRGTMTFPGGNPCTATPETFTFTFDSKALWSKTVAACNNTTKLWDTAWSQYKVPPVPRTVGKHHISVAVGAGSASYTYAIYPAPASPRASPSPSPSPSASPSSSPCAATAALPASGTGGFVDNFIAGAMVAAVLPILGLALFGSPAQLLAAAGRRRKLLQLLGFSLLLFGLMSCTSSVAQGPGESPVAAVSPSQAPTPSPSPSPSPSC
jgi:hypothetical protein